MSPWLKKKIAQSTALVLVYFIGGFPALVYALPNGGQIVAGQGQIQSPTSNQLVIEQSSNQLITNWQGFSIGNAESVRFKQPGADAVSLNRVIGQNPSEILGKLSANGKVFLTNPSGILFGQGSQVNVGALIATTLQITDQDFLNRNYKFTQDPTKPLASIINQGTINGNQIGLLAPRVENQGTIMANLGSIALASGNAATLDFSGDGLIQFAITQPVEGVIKDGAGKETQSGVINSGLIQADGGIVNLSARAAGNLIKSVVNNKGVIRAHSMVKKNGRVFLRGSHDVENSGTVNVSGLDKKLTGGTVYILGNSVRLTDGVVNASGSSGGGTVLIGGDRQGRNESIQNATNTTVAESATIKADAIVNGDGGKIIIWADNSTVVHGMLSATGGGSGGDGGFIETSGKNFLNITQAPDVSAPNGKAGTWLLDPTNIEIVSGPGNGDGSQVSVTTIEDALNAGTSVHIVTSGKGLEEGTITVSTAILKSSGGDTSLTLTAHGDIVINNSISSSNGSLDVNLIAGADIFVNASINTNGGDNILKAGSSVNVNSQINSNGGKFIISSLDEPIADGFAHISGLSQPIRQHVSGSGTQIKFPDINIVGSVMTEGGEISLNKSKTINKALIGAGWVNVKQDVSISTITITGSLDASIPDGTNNAELLTSLITLEGSNVVIDNGSILADNFNGLGGTIHIIGTDWVSLGGRISASGETSGLIKVEAGGLSIAAPVEAKGTTGKGGTIDLKTAFKSWENTDAILDVSGGEGGTIIHIAGQQITTSATYKAIGTTGIGGNIDVTAPALKFLSTQIDASGFIGGGTIRLGGEYQGGKNLNVEEIPNSILLSMTNATTVKADATGGTGDGGTIIAWADKIAIVLGQFSAIPGTDTGGGGFVEVSSGEGVTFGGMVETGIGERSGTFLLDPKNITIAEPGFNQYTIIIGNNYANINSGNVSSANLNLGSGVSLDGNRLAVGTAGDDGTAGTGDGFDEGAVYLFGFTDDSFGGGSLQAIIGEGYTGGKNVNQTLASNDQFGASVSLDGTRLAVGVVGDDGFNEDQSGSGAVFLYTFTDESFSGGALAGIIGNDYSGGKNVSETLVLNDDQFGSGVSLDGLRLAVGAQSNDNGGNDKGAVFLYTFTDLAFTGGTLKAVIGDSFTNTTTRSDINQTSGLSEFLGSSVSLDENRLAVGLVGDDGASNAGDNSGAVYLYTFTDSSFSGGSLVATIGDSYAGGKNIDQSLDNFDFFGSAVSLDGNRLAVGVKNDDSFNVSSTGINRGAVYLYTFTDSVFSGGSLESIIGLNYTGGKNINQNLDTNDDLFGASVSLDGNRLAVGAPLDDGASNGSVNSGSIYLYTFTDTAFTGGVLKDTVGAGFSGGKNISQTLGNNDLFGQSVSIDDTRLAVGAFEDDGSGNVASNSGAVYLYTFTDSSFSGGALAAIVGDSYTGGKNFNQDLDTDDKFGVSISLDGTRLAVGAFNDDGSGLSGSNNKGAVYLYSFTDSSFSGTQLEATIGDGYTGSKNIDQTLENGDTFGRGVSLSGNQLAVGAELDDGFGNSSTNSGAVYLYTFTDSVFSGGDLAAIIGQDYANTVDRKGFDVPIATESFGISLALDGTRLAVGAPEDDGSTTGDGSNEGAVFLFTFNDTTFSTSSLKAIIGDGFTDTTTRSDINQNLDANDRFGWSVSLNGTQLAAGVLGDDGSGNSGLNNGAVYIYEFTDSSFSGGSLDAILGLGYTGGNNVNLAIGSNDEFGTSVSLDSNRLAVGAAKDDGQADGSSNAGAVYLFSQDEDPILDAVFNIRHDKDITISTSTLATLLATPTNVTLQASNDITISDALTVSNSSGDGGNLILQAGRSIIINANITTDNGDLTLIANDLLANGVVDSDRDSGSAVIAMASGKSIDAGTGDVTLELRNGTGKTNMTSGDIGSSSDAITISANSLTSINSGGDIFTSFTSTVATAVTTFSDTTTSTSSSSVTTSTSSTITATTTTGDQATFSDAFGVLLTTDQVATINKNLDQGKQSTLIDDFTELASGKGC